MPSTAPRTTPFPLGDRRGLSPDVVAAPAREGLAMRHRSFLGSFVIAPICLLLGVVGMKFGWKPNRDLDWSVALPLWTGAHLAYIVGFGAFGFVLHTLWRWARDAARSTFERGSVHVLSVAGAVGLVAIIGQMVIDLLVGFEADSRAGMSAISDRYQDIPGFEQFFYGAIPNLPVGVAALLIVLLALRRRVAVWPAAVFFVGGVAIGTQLTALMVAGGLAIGVALYALAREETRVPVGAAI
jgi:hypothetical protein